MFRVQLNKLYFKNTFIFILTKLIKKTSDIAYVAFIWKAN
jgi:hypothetical protein